MNATEKLYMARPPVPMSRHERFGVQRFEAMLKDLERTCDEGNNIKREDALTLVRKMLTELSNEDRRGFELGLTEYLCIVLEGSVPDPGYVLKILEHGEWLPDTA